MSSTDNMSFPPADTRDLRLRFYIGAQSTLAVIAVAAALATSGVPNWPMTIVLAAVCAIAERMAPELSEGVEASVAFLPMALAAVLFGPAAAGIVGASAMLGYVLQWPANQFSVFASARALAGVAAGACAQLALPSGTASASLPRLWSPQRRPPSPRAPSTS